MTRTHSFKDVLQARIAVDPAFAAARLREGIDALLSGNVETGKASLRDHTKATIGFK